ncbi:MAG TPA: hypothetical protein VJS16_00065 [Gammaproteobacteria bacterium]|nr:hypothetical protein [Gammaproteobacteria bacterium]
MADAMMFTLSVFVLFVALLSILIVLFFTKPAKQRRPIILGIISAFLVFVLLTFIFHTSIDITLPVALVWILALVFAHRYYAKVVAGTGHTRGRLTSSSKVKVHILWNHRASVWIMAFTYVPAVFVALGLVHLLPRYMLQPLTGVFWIVVIVALAGWTITGILTLSIFRGINVPIRVIRAALVGSAVLTFVVGWAAWPLAAGHHLLESPLTIVALVVAFAPRLLMEDRLDEPSPIRPLNLLNNLYLHLLADKTHTTA